MKSLRNYILESQQIQLDYNGKENGFGYVDLGLPSGTMWATCNVGADKPEDDGLLFQFGRTDGYKYGDTNNKFRTNSQNIKDTNIEDMPETMSFKIYNKNKILKLEDDAANVNMGGKWRMPTEKQLEELYNNTTLNVETINGVKGMMFTSDINGNCLFIPFAGYWCDEYFYGITSCAHMWSSQVEAFHIYCGYAFKCNSRGHLNIDYPSRSCALSVRGVFKK